jgi:pyruvate/2-oxoglutarate/acetoin dehydrogenase E1 component
MLRVFGSELSVAGCLMGLALTGCAPVVEAPMKQPVDAMEVAWGPFAR